MSNPLTPPEEDVPTHEGWFDDQKNIRPHSPGFSIELLLLERWDEGQWTVTGALLREPGEPVRWVPGWIDSHYQESSPESLWAYLVEKRGGNGISWDVAFLRIRAAAHAPVIAEYYRKRYQQGFTPHGWFEPPAPNPMTLPLDVSQIAKLAKAWDRTGIGTELWDDLVALGTHLLQVQEGDIFQKLRAWHHLLMAVGNFKRPAKSRIVSSLLSEGCAHDKPPVFVERVLAANRFGEPFELVKDDPSTWTALGEVQGLRIATASTILSAIWPGFHVMMDRSAFASALGLAAATGTNVGPLDRRGMAVEDQSVPHPHFDDYPWYRSRVLATAIESVDPVHVERALYQLGRRVVKPPGMSWRDYGSALLAGVK